MSYLRIPKEELTNESYHNRPRSLSSSGIKDCAKSVDLYNFNKANRKETGAMSLGTLAHLAILEPELYKPLILPETSRKSNDDFYGLIQFLDESFTLTPAKLKAYGFQNLKARFTLAMEDKEKEGFQVISQSDFDLIESMKAGIAAHELNEGGRILALDNENIEIESSYFIPVQALEGFEHVKMDLECRARPDYTKHGAYIADLKSTKTSDPARFKYEVLKYGYHVSAAFYLDCYNTYQKWVHRDKIKHLENNIESTKNDYLFSRENAQVHENLKQFLDSITISEFKLVACENTGTGICTIFDLAPELLGAGRKIYREGLWNYINYQDGFVYGGYSSEIVTLNI